MKYGVKLDVVNFGPDYVALGTALEQVKSVSDGQRILSVPVKVYTFNDQFMCVEFCGTNSKEQYKQLIPWARVSGVYSKEMELAVLDDLPPSNRKGK